LRPPHSRRYSTSLIDMSKVATRLGALAIALAVVLVPTIARTRQHVEHRDATRLSIKHSWLGVAPPSKSLVAPQQIVVLPAIVAEPQPRRSTLRVPVAPAPALHPIPAQSPDPLRGPPAFRLS
jgi:hypothetical protein